MTTHRFDADGFAVTSALLSHAACTAIETSLMQIQDKGVGLRYLLDFPWCKELAQSLRRHPAIGELLAPNSVAVQCTYFEKSKEQNWLVPVHQDLSIPVQEKIECPSLAGWSEKEGVIYVQPPDDILHQLVALRLHLDDCGADDGPLKVVPGSHRTGRLDSEAALRERDRHGEHICTVGRGGALIMKPLLLHASSKSIGNSRRRVLHFVFGPPSLPYGLRWRYAV